MPKVKVNVDLTLLKELGIAHGEKIALGVGGLFMVLFVIMLCLIAALPH